MDERLKFVARLLDGEKMAVLCREFEISRKTGYKIYSRYKDCGVDGLTDRSRRPYRHARQLPFQIEKAIVQLKQEHPSWGAPKIRERLRRAHDEIRCPAISTVHAILDRNGLVKRRRRRIYKPEGTPLAHPHHPNDLWCADYKGEFMLADRRYCYPLTITDYASRYLIGCESLSSTKAMYAFTVFERVFKDYGLPRAIRTDNGSPFASANSLFGLTQLSVWWLRLGIDIERIKPGHPQQNGRHERMHLTLKKEATKPAAKNFLQQQARFDQFIDIFNRERPHQGINMRYPAELYTPSPRPYNGLSELEYPFHDRTITVTRCGRICLGAQKVNLSQAFAGQKVGIKQVDDRIWLVSFMRFDLGFFDDETCRIESAENPFVAKLSPMSPV
jgi:putative transposase